MKSLALVWSSAILVAVLVVLALLPVRSDAPRPALTGVGPSPAPRASQAAAVLVGEIHGVDGADASTSARRVRPSTPAARADANEAHPAGTVRGTCVDGSGRPVGDVEVIGLVTLDTPPTGKVPRTRTDTSGRFVLLLPIEAAPSVLMLRARGFAPLGVDLQQHQGAGPERDLGALTLPAGIPAGGLLHDADGAPVAGANVRLEPLGAAPSHQGRALPLAALTAADGSFDLGDCLAGDYIVRVPGRELRTPARASLRPGRGPTSLTLVVATAGRPVIEGVVTDRGGHPLTGARIQALDSEGGRHTSTTDAEGRFSLERAGAVEGPVRLQGLAAGHDVTEHPGQVEWGERGLRLVLDPAAMLDLRVTDAGGRPVRAFGVRLYRRDGHALAPVQFGAALPLLHSGEHEQGSLRIEGVLRGRYELRVEPLEGAGCAASPFLPVDLTRGGDARLDVSLPARTERTLRIVTADGRPVVGGRVTLASTEGEPLALDAALVEAADWGRLRPARRGLILDTGRTDEGGRVTLAGPAGLPIDLRLEGPGCVPQVWRVPRLDGPGALNLIAPSGAALEVRVLQPELLAPLAEACGRAPQLRLVRGGTGRGVPLPSDGSTVRVVLEPGTWTPVLDLGLQELELGPVVLGGGGAAELTVDLSSLRPVTIGGRLLEAGHPLALQGCSLERLTPDPRGGAARWRGVEVTTDGAGRFARSGLPGTYRLTVPGRSEGASEIQAAPGDFVVAAGERAELDFTVRTGELVLQFLDAEGAPVAGVRSIQVLRSQSSDYIAELGPSEADGSVRLPECEVGSVFVRVLPERLGERRAQVDLLMKSGDPAALERSRIAMGRIEVLAGETTWVELVLPQEYVR